MSSVAKWQDDQDWAKAEVYRWLQKSLAIETPGPGDIGTSEMLLAIGESLSITENDEAKLGALLMQATLAGRTLVHAFAGATNQTPEQALSRLVPGPPPSGHAMGGQPT